MTKFTTALMLDVISMVLGFKVAAAADNNARQDAMVVPTDETLAATQAYLQTEEGRAAADRCSQACNVAASATADAGGEDPRGNAKMARIFKLLCLPATAKDKNAVRAALICGLSAPTARGVGLVTVRRFLDDVAPHTTYVLPPELARQPAYNDYVGCYIARFIGVPANEAAVDWPLDGKLAPPAAACSPEQAAQAAQQKRSAGWLDRAYYGLSSRNVPE